MSEFVTTQQIGEAADFVRAHTTHRPEVGLILGSGLGPVSYTHLDVYKRQP